MNELMITGSMLAGSLYVGVSSKNDANKALGYTAAALSAYLIWSRWQGPMGQQWFMNKRDGII